MVSQIEKGKAPSAAGQSLAVDPVIWKTIAANRQPLPTAGSSVYYFSEGHAEQCGKLVPRFVSFDFECLLADVHLRADPVTDQVFATFNLTTELPPPATKRTKSSTGNGVYYVPTTLTKNETSWRGKFLKLPANSEVVFGYTMPGDDVEVFDLNDRRWTFRYVFTGANYLLTSGWSRFVSSKLLVAGDTVVFMRGYDRTIFVGLRRCDKHKFNLRCMNMESSSRGIIKRRPLKHREDVKMVIDAMRWGEEGGKGMVEARYYPDTKLPAYVVEKGVVEKALSIPWWPGMRVMKNLNTGNGIVREIGILRAISSDSNETSWRMLEVIWNERKKTYENPWDVIPITSIEEA